MIIKMSKQLMILFMAFIFFSSCQTIEVSVSSLSSQNPIEHNNIMVIPAYEKVNINNDLLWREFYNDITLALTIRGFHIIENPDQADQVVIVLYGISDPKNTSQLIPMYGPTSVQSALTNGLISSTGNTSTYSGNTSYSYNYGVTGYSSIQKTVYTRILKLTSYDFKHYQNTQESKVLWYTEIISTGYSSDLRMTFPYLVYASEKFLGEQTNKAIKLRITELDQKVDKYKNN